MGTQCFAAAAAAAALVEEAGGPTLSGRLAGRLNAFGHAFVLLSMIQILKVRWGRWNQ